MPKPGWEDLSAFFSPDEFATTAVITRGAEEVAEVLGIFDDPNEVASLGDYNMDHPTPRFTCPAAAVVDVRYKDTATIDGTAYDVMQEPELDGTGLATLILAEPNVTYDAGV
ncbi:head-tail joining protein [uncultured Tateyamaria sp.]|uniref:head-tail joining protein n=1 Tax=uncultured Tateyamaria sp. TaxID=455651 RepID=UPI00261546FA|nr:head-tail joining protein [uncultured Tateyamaria sp.]